MYLWGINAGSKILTSGTKFVSSERVFDAWSVSGLTMFSTDFAGAFSRSGSRYLHSSRFPSLRLPFGRYSYVRKRIATEGQA